MLDVGVVQSDACVKDSHLDQLPSVALIPEQLGRELGDYTGPVRKQPSAASGTIRILMQTL